MTRQRKTPGGEPGVKGFSTKETTAKRGQYMEKDESLQVISRKDALEVGLKHYFTGVPCLHGHTDKRYVSDGACMACARGRLRLKYAKNPEAQRQRHRERRRRMTDEDRAKLAARVRELRKINPDRFKAADAKKYKSIMGDPERRQRELERQNEKQKRAYRQDPERYKAAARLRHSFNKEKANEQARQWKINNPEKVRALNEKWGSFSRAARKKRIPPWLTEEDFAQINALYKKARESGLQVDHIIPLQGKLVSGLHVPSNLQPLTRSENASKRNRYEVK